MSALVKRQKAVPEISTLSKVLDPVELCKHLQVGLPQSWGTPHAAGLNVIQHHPGRRCTLRIALHTTVGAYQLIGKVYAMDRRDVYDVMERLAKDGFGPREEFSIPEPVAYVPALRLLLQEEVEGSLARELFAEGDEASLANAAARCACWLAHFHARAPKSGKPFDVNHYLASVERWSRRIARRVDPLADKVFRLCAWIIREGAALQCSNSCPGHGSYNHRQIIFSAARTVTTDWDGYCLADPSRDVARFSMSLRQLSLNGTRPNPALDEATRIFERAYISLGQLGALRNLRFYKAAISLQLAKYEIHQRVSHWREAAEALISEGIRVTAQEF